MALWSALTVSEILVILAVFVVTIDIVWGKN